MESIFVVKFNVESEAFQALTELRQQPVNDNYVVSQACLVTKKDGRITALDQFDTGLESLNDTGTGTVVGALVGILGGPIGVLLGASYGAMVGSVVDTADILDNSSLIEQVCETIAENETAVIALVSETNVETFDAAMKKFNTEVKWFDAGEVAAEVEKAREMERQMKIDAIKQLHEEKKDDFKQKVEEYRKKISGEFENLKKKLS